MVVVLVPVRLPDSGLVEFRQRLSDKPSYRPSLCFYLSKHRERAMSSMNAQDVLVGLAESNNNVAAGIGECIRAFSNIVNGGELTGPVMIEFGDRTIALGRKRLGSMSGRVRVFFRHRSSRACIVTTG
jgi:hypothetical protein